MSNVQINIKAIEDKGKYMLITGQDNVKWSCFKDKSPAVVNLKPGDEIEADGVEQKKGNFTYHNFGAFHVIARNTAPQAPSGQGVAPIPPKVEVSGPERGNAVTNICNLWIAGKLQDSNPLVLWALAQLHQTAGTGK